MVRDLGHVPHVPQLIPRACLGHEPSDPLIKVLAFVGHLQAPARRQTVQLAIVDRLPVPPQVYELRDTLVAPAMILDEADDVETLLIEVHPVGMQPDVLVQP
jgi:hypothetical protein